MTEKRVPRPREVAEYFFSQGVITIPVKKGTKEPEVRRLRKRDGSPLSLGEIINGSYVPGEDEVLLFFPSGATFDNISLGAVCGPPSRLVVIDFDDARAYFRFKEALTGGEFFLDERNVPSEKKELVEKVEKFNEAVKSLKKKFEKTLKVKTGKGFHVYFHVPEDEDLFFYAPITVPEREDITSAVVGNKKNAPVEWKGSGYVVAPFSVHPSGKRYEPAEGSKIPGTEIQELSPEEVSALLYSIARFGKGGKNLAKALKKYLGPLFEVALEDLDPYYEKEAEKLEKKAEEEEIAEKVEEAETGETKTVFTEKELSEKISELNSLLDRYGVFPPEGEGYGRTLFLEALAVMLLKKKIDPEVVQRICEAVVARIKDERYRQQKLREFRRRYRRILSKFEAGQIEDLAGKTLLFDESDPEAMEEGGMPKNLLIYRYGFTPKKAKAFLAELISIFVKKRRIGRLLETKYGRDGVNKFFLVNDPMGGIVLQKILIVEEGDKKGSRKVSTSKISPVFIQEVRPVRIIGVSRADSDLLYVRWKALTGGGQERLSIGKASDVVKEIKEVVGISRMKYGEGAITTLIWSMRESEEKEIFYAPGPWLIRGRKKFFLKIPGEDEIYKPSWDQGVRPEWSPAADEEDKMFWGLVDQGLRLVKKFVESYRDPSMASTAICFGIVAWLCHYVKSRYSFFPHLAIYGRENTGKTAMVEMIRLLYGANWHDSFERTEASMRRALASTTIPMMIDEMSDIFKEISAGKGEITALYSYLILSAADSREKVIPHGPWAGIYVPIRCAIFATNEDPLAVTSVNLTDKAIFLMIDKDSALDPKKARGATPNTMREKDRRAVAALGLALMKKVAELFPKFFSSEANLTREEIPAILVRLGYEAFKLLFERFGLKPFPEPAVRPIGEQTAGREELVQGAFISWVRRVDDDVRNRRGVSIFVDPSSDPEAVSRVDVLLQDPGVVILKEKGTEYLYITPVALSNFRKFLSKTYALDEHLASLRTILRLKSDKQGRNYVLGKRRKCFKVEYPELLAETGMVETLEIPEKEETLEDLLDPRKYNEFRAYFTGDKEVPEDLPEAPEVPCPSTSLEGLNPEAVSEIVGKALSLELSEEEVEKIKEKAEEEIGKGYGKEIELERAFERLKGEGLLKEISLDGKKIYVISPEKAGIFARHYNRRMEALWALGKLLLDGKKEKIPEILGTALKIPLLEVLAEAKRRGFV